MRIWYYYIAALIVVTIMLFILIQRRKSKRKLEKIDYSAEGRNIALSITKCKALHKQLVKVIHPDKFDGPEKKFADELMQEINSSKYDYQQLSNLKLEVETFLNQKL